MNLSLTVLGKRRAGAGDQVWGKHPVWTCLQIVERPPPNIIDEFLLKRVPAAFRRLAARATREVEHGDMPNSSAFAVSEDVVGSEQKVSQFEI